MGDGDVVHSSGTRACFDLSGEQTRASSEGLFDGKSPLPHAAASAFSDFSRASCERTERHLKYVRAERSDHLVDKAVMQFVSGSPYSQNKELA